MGESPDVSRNYKIARARALVSYTANRNLSFSGSEVVRRLNGEHSAISRVAQRVSRATTKTIPELLELEAIQH